MEVEMFKELDGKKRKIHKLSPRLKDWVNQQQFKTIRVEYTDAWRQNLTAWVHHVSQVTERTFGSPRMSFETLMFTNAGIMVGEKRFDLPEDVVTVLWRSNCYICFKSEIDLLFTT